MGGIVKVTSKGQVTIPVEIRECFGLLPGTQVEFVVDGGEVKIVQAALSRPGRGSRVVDRLRGSAAVRMTTEEIMKLTRGPA